MLYVCGGKQEAGGGVAGLLSSPGSLPSTPWGEEVTGPSRHSPMTSNALLTPVCEEGQHPSPPHPTPPDTIPRPSYSHYKDWSAHRIRICYSSFPNELFKQLDRVSCVIWKCATRPESPTNVLLSTWKMTSMPTNYGAAKLKVKYISYSDKKKSPSDEQGHKKKKKSNFFLTNFGRYFASSEIISTPASVCAPALTAQAPAWHEEN